MQRRDFLVALALAALTGRPAHGQLTMQRRPIPSSGEELPVVGFGTWQSFDVDPEDEDAMSGLREVLDILAAHGGSVVDSSPMYGRAEEVVGRLLRDELFLATKVWTRGRNAGREQIARSRRLMARGGTLDLVQVHNLVDWRVQLDALRAMRRDGSIRYIGLTHYTDRGRRELIDVLERVDDVDFVQCAYSLVEPGAADDLLPLCTEREIAFIANRPFAGGAAFRRTRDHAVPGWAQARFDARTWAQFFLKFVLAHPAVTCVIPGTGHPRYALDNVKAGFGALPDANDRARMIELWDAMR